MNEGRMLETYSLGTIVALECVAVWAKVDTMSRESSSSSRSIMRKR